MQEQRLDLHTVDEAENIALWNLLATLESTLWEPFSPHYLALLNAARDRLRPRA